MEVGAQSRTEAGNRLQSLSAYVSEPAAQTGVRGAGVDPERHRPENPLAPASGGGSNQPAAVAQISDAGRAALAAAQAPAPADRGAAAHEAAHVVQQRAAAAPSKDTDGNGGSYRLAAREVGGNLRTAAHEAAHVVQQRVAAATSQDSDGNGGLDRLSVKALGGNLQQIAKAHHEMAKSIIQNIRA